jgi:hypothetical protein
MKLLSYLDRVLPTSTLIRTLDICDLAFDVSNVPLYSPNFKKRLISFQIKTTRRSQPGSKPCGLMFSMRPAISHHPPMTSANGHKRKMSFMPKLQLHFLLTRPPDVSRSKHFPA